MQNKRYDTILFDMDGTISDSDEWLYQTFLGLYDFFPSGKRKSREEAFSFSGPPIKLTLKQEFPNEDQDFVYQKYNEISYPLYEKYIKPFPYCLEVLTKLKEDGFKLGIITNKHHKLTIYSLGILGLENCFDIVVGLDDVANGKPNKEGIEKAIKILEGKKAIYIGDNLSDFLTANNAGIDCALVDWGPRILPPEAKPKFKMKSYKDILEFVYE